VFSFSDSCSFAVDHKIIKYPEVKVMLYFKGCYYFTKLQKIFIKLHSQKRHTILKDYLVMVLGQLHQKVHWIKANGTTNGNLGEFFLAKFNSSTSL
jgi:hypothetical protein